MTPANHITPGSCHPTSPSTLVLVILTVIERVDSLYSVQMRDTTWVARTVWLVLLEINLYKEGTVKPGVVTWYGSPQHNCDITLHYY